MLKIKIIYFCYLIPDDWSVLHEQIDDLKKSGMYTLADELYINCVVIKDREKEFRELIKTKANKFTIYSVTDENCFEYTGIKCLKETAEPNSLSFYFHTKGITTKSQENDNCRKFLLKELSAYNKIIKIFLKYPKTDKVTCFSSTEGWCWYNFYWARGEFLIKNKLHVSHINDLYWFMIF